MRILHLVAYSLYSGPVPSTLGLALAQRARGDEVWLGFDTKRGAINDFEEAAAPRLKHFELDPPERFTLSTKSSPIELVRDVLRLKRLAQSVDVVHVHMSHDHTLARLAFIGGHRPRLVRTFHAERSLTPRLGQRGLTRFADAWIVRAQDHERRLTRLFGLTGAHVIPGGIDANDFKPQDSALRAKARKRFAIPENARVLGHVALIAGRGQQELAMAVAQLPKDERPHLVYVGRGEQEEALRRHVTSLGLDPWTRFTGYLAGPELLEGYAMLDAAFVAQPGNDASARAALEAMACGLPTLAVTQGALAEAVTEERGYPVDSRSPMAILATLRDWLASHDEALARAERARRYVLEERSFAREAELTARAYQAP